MSSSEIKGKLTPVVVRNVLFVLLALSVAVSCFVFINVKDRLQTYTNSVLSASAKAQDSNDHLQELQKLQQMLEDDSIAVNRASKIVADSEQYQYQGQIIDDITSYATKAGVIISGFTFINSDDASQGNPQTQENLPGGLKSTSAVIAVQNPVDYKAAMKFIHSIEDNLTKMNITSISVAASPGNNKVMLNPITIEVYMR